MATIYNSNLTKELVDVARIQVSSDKVPNQIADKVVPVIDVNPKHSRNTNLVKVGVLANSTSGNIFTTDSIKDTYITGVQLGYIKDATATTTLISVAVTLEEQGSTTIVSLPSLTLTAAYDSIFIPFNNPLKLQRSTTPTVRSATNVGNISANAVLYGFTVDNSQA